MIRGRSATTAARPTAGAGERLSLDPDAVLESYPGPAVLLDPLGRAVATNGLGAALAGTLQDARADANLRAAVAGVLSDHTAGAREVKLESEAGDGTVVDVSLLPLTTVDGAVRVLLLGRETTVERGFIDALVESRRLFRDLVNASSDFAWETNAEGRFGFVSSRGAIGYTAQELNGRVAYELMAAERPEPEVFPFDSRIPLEDAEVWLASKAAALACLIVTCVPVFGEDGAYRGTRGVCKDVTEARARDAALAKARNRARLLGRIMEAIRNEVAPTDMLAAAASATSEALNASNCWTLRGDHRGLVIASRCGAAAPDAVEAAILDSASRGVPGATLEFEAGGYRLLAAAAAYRGQVNGAIAFALPLDSPAIGDDQRALLAEVADRLGIAIEQVANTELLERLSRTDELTGLLNRRAFFEEVGRRLGHQQRTGRPGALMYVDIDNFKVVNDALGHAAGDDVLRAVAGILTAGSRIGDVTARIGGGEFAVWIEEADSAAARTKAALVLEEAGALSRWTPDAGRPLGLSVGIAVSAMGESVTSLLTRADEAMFQAKRAGKGRLTMAPPAQGGE